jgi:hypothetical protein
VTLDVRIGYVKTKFLSASFIKQRQLPFSKGEFRAQVSGLIEICKRTVIFALCKGTVHRCIQFADFYSVLTGQTQ